MEPFAEKIEALIPRGLDDVIRANRDKVRLRIASGQEVMALHKDIRPGIEKDVLDNWHMVVFEDLLSGDIVTRLLGNGLDGYPWMTSMVTKIDLDRNYVVTKSNSLYRLGNQGKGEPSFEQLALVCASLHRQGLGGYLGVPRFFF